MAHIDIGILWGDRPARQNFLPCTQHYLKLILSIDSGQPVTQGEPETSESARHRFGMLYPEKYIAL